MFGWKLCNGQLSFVDLAIKKKITGVDMYLILCVVVTYIIIHPYGSGIILDVACNFKWCTHVPPYS